MQLDDLTHKGTIAALRTFCAAPSSLQCRPCAALCCLCSCFPEPPPIHSQIHAQGSQGQHTPVAEEMQKKCNKCNPADTASVLLNHRCHCMSERRAPTSGDPTHISHVPHGYPPWSWTPPYGATRCRPVPPGAGCAGRAARCRPVPSGAVRCRPVPPGAARCRPVPCGAVRCRRCHLLLGLPHTALAGKDNT